MRGQRAVRIVALALVLRGDPVEGFQVAAGCSYSSGLSLAFDPSGSRGGSSAACLIVQIEFGAVQVQQLAEKVAGHADVGTFMGLMKTVRDASAHGQRLAVAVEDRAARRRNLLPPLPGGPAPCGVLLVMNDLQRDQIVEDGRAPEQDDERRAIVRRRSTMTAQREGFTPPWLLTLPSRPRPAACLPDGRPGPSAGVTRSVLCAPVAPTAPGLSSSASCRSSPRRSSSRRRSSMRSASSL